MTPCRSSRRGHATILLVSIGSMAVMGGCRDLGVTDPDLDPWNGLRVMLEPDEATLEFGFTQKLQVIAGGAQAPSQGLPPVVWATAPSDPHIAVQPDLVNPAGTMLRVRFEVHALDAGFQLAACFGEIVAAVDRMTPEGWDPGPKPLFCNGGPYPPPISPGGCLRGVRYRGGYEPGDHRLRLWSRFVDEEAAFVSDVFRP